MARETVSPFERHVEKAVLVAAGAALLAIAILYLIGTPNTVEIAGRRVGPSQADPQVKKQAEALLRRLKTDQWPPEPVQPYAPELKKVLDSALTYAGLPTGPIAAAAPWPSQVPTIEVGEGEQATAPKTLAGVVRPTKPQVKTGRSSLDIELAAAPGASTYKPTDTPRGVRAALREPQDKSWATIVALLDEKGQHEIFLENHYDTTRFRIDVVSLLVQRQQQQPDATWGDWENVTPFSPYAAPEPPTLRLIKPRERWRLPPEQEKQLEAFVEDLRGHQEEIRRPLFPDTPFGDPWDLPKVEGIDWDLIFERDYSHTRRSFPALRPGPRGEFDPRVAGPYSRDGPYDGPYAGDRPRREQPDRRQAAKDLNEAKEALKDEDWKLAAQLARAVLADRDAQRLYLQQAERILNQATNELEEIERKRQELSAARRAGGDAAQVLGPRPVWIHDLTVAPGRTYRWRLKFALLNSYVGNAARLKNKEDAERITIESDWSAASDPVTIENDLYFYLAQVPGAMLGGQQDAASLRARIEAYKWVRGQWIEDKFYVRTGEPIIHEKQVALASGSPAQPPKQTVLFDAQAVVVDIQPEKTVRIRQPKSDETFIFREVTTACLVYEDAAGHLVERLRDQDRRNPKRKELQEKAKTTERPARKLTRGMGDRLREARFRARPAPPRRGAEYDPYRRTGPYRGPGGEWDRFRDRDREAPERYREYDRRDRRLYPRRGTDRYERGS